MIKVLITDDQMLLAEGIKSVLEASGKIEVTDIAKDGIECLESIKKNRPEVVLLDIRMPNMNGVIATREIKRTYPDVKVERVTIHVTTALPPATALI